MAFLLKVIGVLLLLFFTNTGDVFAFDDIINGDFDDGLNGWSKNVSTLTTSASDSAAILQSSSTSTKYLYQIVPATGSATYKFSGRAKILSGSVSAYLRVSEENTSHDSTHSIQSDWTDLSVSFTTASNTASLKLKINLDPNSASPSSLLWDSVRLERVLPLTINYSSPAIVSAGQSFYVPVNLTNGLSATKYFVKGVSDNEIDTFNTSWLAWNGSWADMPSLVTDISGSVSGIFQLRFNDSSISAQRNFFVRLRQEGTTNNIDSLETSILVEPSPVSTISATQPTSQPEVTSSTKLTNTIASPSSQVLSVATESSETIQMIFIDSPPPDPIDPKPVFTESNNDVSGTPLISWGMMIFGSALSSIFLKNRQFGV